MPRPADVPRSARRGRSTVLLAALLAVAIAPTPGHAGPAKLVKDIERSTWGCDASQMLPGNGGLYFGTALGCRSGLALWRTDGTLAGTQVVKTFEPGPRGFGQVHTVAVVDDLVYFGLVEGEAIGSNITELWRSDGTEAGTIRVWEAGAGQWIESPFLSAPRVAAGFDGKLVFVVDEGHDDASLWVSDGTPGGTFALPDPVAGRFDPYGFIVRDDALFILLTTEAAGFILWRTDGTPGGGALAGFFSEQFPGGGGGDSIALGPDGALYFVVARAAGFRELWRSDGTLAGSSKVLDLPFATFWVISEGVHYVLESRRIGVRLYRFDPVGLDLELLKVLEPTPTGDNDLTLVAERDGVSYFTHFGYTPFREHLWRSDGTAGGTFEIYAGPTAGGVFPTAHGVAFQPYPEGESFPLWHSDGSVAGTRQIFDGGSPVVGYDHFLPLGDVTVFVAGFVDGPALLRTDGTAGGTWRLARIGGDAWNVGVHDGVGVLLVASTLWRSDGSDAGTYRLAELGPNTFGSDPSSLATVADEVFFTVGRRGGQANELWRSDGTRPGTKRVRDFPDGVVESRELTGSGDLLLFARGATKLWASDGTAAGTQQIADLSGGGPDGRIREIHDVGGLAFVTVVDDGRYPNGSLWSTDGTTAGTHLVKNHLAPSRLASRDGTLYFSAPTDSSVAGLWRSDGSAAGTVRVATFSALSERRRPEIGPLFVGDDEIFFSLARLGRTDLWRTDGTALGTTRVATLPEVSGASGKLVVDGGAFAGDLLVFAHPVDFVFRSQLWRSDGTEGGTQQIVADYEYVAASTLTQVGDRVFFLAFGETPGGLQSVWQLWVTDGSDAGTTVVFDGEVRGAPYVVGDVVYFCGNEDDGEYRVWRSDGTPAGTVLAFGRTPRCTGDFAATSDRLLFPAYNDRYGTEPWSGPLEP